MSIDRRGEGTAERHGHELGRGGRQPSRHDPARVEPEIIQGWRRGDGDRAARQDGAPVGRLRTVVFADGRTLK